MGNEGLREIAALATASQAFELCSGRVTYATTLANSDAVTARLGIRGRGNLREVLNRVATLGIQLIAGIEVLPTPGQGPVSALIAGLCWHRLHLAGRFTFVVAA